MAKKEKPYKKLPGRARKKFGFLDPSMYRLWLAKDHILNMRLSYMYLYESYKRFYFKDIQAIVVTRTNSARTLNAVFGSVTAVLVIFLLLCVFWWNSDTPVIAALGVAAGIPLLMFMVNLLIGPTCRCRLHTAVQVEDLVSLGRLRTALKVVASLRPLIEEAQGRLTPEDLEDSSEEQVSIAASSHAVPAAAYMQQPFSMPAAETAETRHEEGKYHAGLFFILIVVAISSYSDIFFQHQVKNLFDSILGAALILVAIIALRKQSNTDLPKAVRLMPWYAMGVTIASFLFGMIYGPIYLIRNPELFESSPFGYYYSDLQFEGPVFVIYCILAAIAYSAIGVLGIIRLQRFQREYDAHRQADARLRASEEGIER